MGSHMYPASKAIGGRHRIQISKPFYMSKYEVTQAQWIEVMETSPWTGERFFKEGNDYAASYISWDDAIRYCQKLTERLNQVYRLPTEAEWEYACRAGTTTAYSFGDEYENRLAIYAWYRDNTYRIKEGYAHIVGQKLSNPWGLHDMHGNVYEWCSDFYDEGYYSKSPPIDPLGPLTGSLRVIRGGGWNTDAEYCQSGDRSLGEDGDYSRGFRVVLDLNQVVRKPGPTDEWYTAKMVAMMEQEEKNRRLQESINSIRRTGQVDLSTPENCFKSFFNALKAKSSSAFLACISPEVLSEVVEESQEEFDAGFKRFSEEVSAVTSIQFGNKRIIETGKVELTVIFIEDEEPDEELFKIEKQGNYWLMSNW